MSPGQKAFDVPICQRRCQGRDRGRAAGIFTARLEDGTTVAIDGSRPIAQDKGDVRESEPNELRHTNGRSRPMRERANCDGCTRMSGFHPVFLPTISAH